ncbi:protein JINGUBANG-like [Cucurbita maxima]|uniref:Protein JINGUBANG-like n=1 Tax=Cucurbita maxima TaxID=3661 RepID=A0A6J1K1V0_CUCMA|nr:protein JINGUBANG-like [Cucurbita maxima]
MFHVHQNYTERNRVGHCLSLPLFANTKNEKSSIKSCPESSSSFNNLFFQMGIMEFHQTFHNSDQFSSSSSSSSSCLTTFKGHSSYISSLTLAGKFLYSGSSDKEIRSWRRSPSQEFESNHEEFQNNMVTAGHGAVKSLVVSSDKLYSAHQDQKIRVWKISNEFDHHQKYTRLATLPTLGDRTARLLMPNNQVQIRRHKKCTWVHHVDTVSALALSNDESLLYSVSWDRTLKIWRTSDFKCLESVAGAHNDAINAVAIAGDGDVYTGSTDKRIKVWRKNPDGKRHFLVQTLEKHSSGINALALAGDGSALFSGACDRSVLVWEKEEEGGLMEYVGMLRGHSKAILCLTVVLDLVCSGSADKTIRIWRRAVAGNYVCLRVLEGHNGPVKCLAAGVDRCNQNDRSFVVYSGGLDCDIKAWQISVPLV